MKNKKLLIAILCIFVFDLPGAANRIRQNFDFDWQFRLGENGDFREVQLPHDWSVELDFDEIFLLEPVDLSDGEKHSFCFNYFEDCVLETANYDPAVCKLETGKIGRGEFGRVMLAAYTLYQCILPDCGDLEVNGEKVESDFSVGWLNHILGTGYTKFGSAEAMPPVTTFPEKGSRWQIRWT